MPTFSYQAIDVDGHEVAGTLEAGGLGAAIDKVRALGLFPGSVNEDSAGGGSLRRFFGVLAGLRFGRKSRQARIALFTRELADLLTAGVPLPLSLSILHDRQKPGRLKNVLRELARDVEAGIALSDALEKHRLLFDDIFVNIVRATEEKQALPEMLYWHHEATKKDRALKLKAKYFVRIPLTLLVMACLYFILFITISFPPFAEIFLDMGGSLSPRKSFLMNSYNLIHGSSLEILCALIVAIFAFKALSRIKIVRSAWDATLLLLPIWGNIIRKISIARFARTLRALMRIGIPFDRAINIAADTIGNSVLHNSVLIEINNIGNGQGISPLEKTFRLLSPHTLNLVSGSREKKDFSAILAKFADTSEQEVTHLMDIVILLVTPCMILLFSWGLLTIIVALFTWNGSIGDLV